LQAAVVTSCSQRDDGFRVVPKPAFTKRKPAGTSGAAVDGQVERTEERVQRPL
jgi:hypothetical protein